MTTTIFLAEEKIAEMKKITTFSKNAKENSNREAFKLDRIASNFETINRTEKNFNKDIFVAYSL